MNSRILRMTLGLLLTAVPAFLIGCSSNGTSFNSAPQTGTVAMVVSDASNEDWATIGVKLLSISLIPQGGGTPVNVYTAPNPAPTTNLVELDQLGEILGNVTVNTGTYTGAILTVSANPSDILLTVSANPETGFAGTAGATIPSSQIQVIGATGASGSQTVPVHVTFDSPLVVTANQSNALDLEFDLSHPAFLVGHVPPSAGTVIWAMNFKGPVRHHPLPDLTRLVLRHIYGTVGSVSNDNTSITITRDFPVEPPTNPETAISSSFSQKILADATNGTLFYDLDAKTVVTIKDFSSLTSSLPNKFVRIAARYQSDGSLIGVRIYASSTFNTVWISPEGHVLHVDRTNFIITVEGEDGKAIPLQVDANTKFFYRQPWDSVKDASPIGQGTGFLAAATTNFVRGFKVHASADISQTPYLAQDVDIEIARYDGTISNATLNNFIYTRNFATLSDDYIFTIPFISSNTPNGKDSSGNAITGFKWWNFAFPTVVDSGTNAITDFDNAVNGGINFGNGISFSARGATFATWGDPNNLNGWAAPWTVIVPTRIPLGTAATGYANGNPTGSFMMSLPGGSQNVKIDLSTVSGSGTLVYQVDRTNLVVTISPVDITTSAGQTTLTTNLISGTPVKVFGVPQADGSVKAYVVTYFTGVTPTAVF
jgi:hypothetical protein